MANTHPTPDPYAETLARVAAAADKLSLAAERLASAALTIGVNLKGMKDAVSSAQETARVVQVQHSDITGAVRDLLQQQRDMSAALLKESRERRAIPKTPARSDAPPRPPRPLQPGENGPRTG